jgi:hypothetical protein
MPSRNSEGARPKARQALQLATLQQLLHLRPLDLQAIGDLLRSEYVLIAHVRKSRHGVFFYDAPIVIRRQGVVRGC